MLKNDELLKLLPLDNSQLKAQAILKAREILMSDKYKKYDNEFKKNFATGFVENYLDEISKERVRIAGEMMLQSQNKKYIMQVTGLSLEEIEKITIPTNSSQILKEFEKLKKQ